MTRLRATLARSAADRELHQQLAQVVRYLGRAQDVCLRMSRTRDPAMQTEAQRARVAQRILQQVRGLIDQVGYLTPGYDQADPDLIPEATKRPPPVKRAEKKRTTPEHFIRETLERMRDQDAE